MSIKLYASRLTVPKKAQYKLGTVEGDTHKHFESDSTSTLENVLSRMNHRIRSVSAQEARRHRNAQTIVTFAINKFKLYKGKMCLGLE